MKEHSRLREQARVGSARNIKITKTLRIFCAALLLLLLIAIIKSFSGTIFKLSASVAALSVGYACLRLMACLTPKPRPDADTPSTAPQIWPYYTVLVPLYREAHMVQTLMDELSKLDYPQDRLEIFMICEASDPATTEAVNRHIRPTFRLITAPPITKGGEPQTKPRALNIALQQANGAFVTIYDAEDIPDPSQLKIAVRQFFKNPKLGALQAPLDYANSEQSWITRQFTLEYAALFHVWLPFLASAGLPFPLGGTSNHMRRTALDGLDIGGWDSYNVTEDADLSYRLAANGWELGYITPPTQEEAVSSWRAWHYQRSRWMKGYMQTWLVHMRAPLAPGGWAGLKRFFTLQLTVGLTLVNALFHLPVIITILCFHGYMALSGEPTPIARHFILSLVISYVMGIVIGAVGAYRSGKPHLIITAITMPFYWLALFPPTMRALWELWRAPFLWHKTEHGVMAPASKPLETMSRKPREPKYDALR